MYAPLPRTVRRHMRQQPASRQQVYPVAITRLTRGTAAARSDELAQPGGAGPISRSAVQALDLDAVHVTPGQ